jgi:hypothetical protein
VVRIPYSSLDSLSGAVVTFPDARGKRTKVKLKGFADRQMPTGTFYSCYRMKEVPLPDNVPFSSSYTIMNRDLLFLHSLWFDSEFRTDTFFYDIRLPLDFCLVYDIPHPELAGFIHIDTVLEPNSVIYRFTIVLKEQQEMKTAFARPDDRLREKSQLVRLLIAPIQYRGAESAYFVRRLRTLYHQPLILNDQTKALIDSLTGICTIRDSIISHLLRFAATKIRYLDVEVGYGSFVPDDVNHVAVSRQGDCKGLSAFLTQALRYKGFEADLALVSTLRHDPPMDFPSFSSGDHMVCALKENEGWTFLDPTDKHASYRTTSAGIQGCSAFILDGDAGVFLSIPVTPPGLNPEIFNFDLTLHDGMAEGFLTYSCTGCPAEMLSDFVLNTGAVSLDTDLADLVKYWFSDIHVSKPFFTLNRDTATIRSQVAYGKSACFESNGILYVSLRLIPVLFSLPNYIKHGQELIFGRTILKKGRIIIDPGRKIGNLTLPVIHHAASGLKMDIVAENTDHHVIINFELSCDRVLVREAEIGEFKAFEMLMEHSLSQFLAIH